MFKDWNIEEMTGYKPLTTYYYDFSIADHFGERAIRETYDEFFAKSKDDYKLLTELVMVLNWKIWEWYEKNDEFGQLYNDLWEKVDAYACNHLKGEEAQYFFATTD